MKKGYETPEVNVIMFEAEDVVTTSTFTANGEFNQINFGDFFGTSTTSLDS